MFDGWRQLILTAGAVSAVALAKVHRIRRVVTVKTKNTVPDTPSCVGVWIFLKLVEILEIDLVE